MVVMTDSPAWKICAFAILFLTACSWPAVFRKFMSASLGSGPGRPGDHTSEDEELSTLMERYPPVSFTGDAASEYTRQLVNLNLALHGTPVRTAIDREK
jgi:hypothetical protein